MRAGSTLTYEIKPNGWYKNKEGTITVSEETTVSGIKLEKIIVTYYVGPGAVNYGNSNMKNADNGLYTAYPRHWREFDKCYQEKVSSGYYEWIFNNASYDTEFYKFSQIKDILSTSNNEIRIYELNTIIAMSTYWNMSTRKINFNASLYINGNLVKKTEGSRSKYD